MDASMIPIFGIVFSIGGPMVMLIVWITLDYHKRRRLMELNHAERMAAIERGMDLPPLPIDLLDGRRPRRRRSSLLPGLVWFFIGLALVIGMRMIDGDVPLIGGLIPLGIGVAYLIYYFVEGRHVEARQLEHDHTQQSNSRQLHQPPDTL